MNRGIYDFYRTVCRGTPEEVERFNFLVNRRVKANLQRTMVEGFIKENLDILFDSYEKEGLWLSDGAVIAKVLEKLNLEYKRR